MAFIDWVMWSTRVRKAAWVVMGVTLPLAASSALSTAVRLASVTPLARLLSCATVGAVAVVALS